MKLQKLALGTAVAAACGVGMAGNANADALAQSLLTINNFVITNGSGTPLALSDFSQLSFIDTLTNDAILNGATDHHQVQSTGFAPVTDAAQACVGTGCPGENVFTSVGTPPTDTYARSDSLLTGQPISGTGQPVGANASAIAVTSLSTDATGGSSSDILLTSGFTFVATHDIAQAGFSFDATTFLQAWTAAGTTDPTGAGAGFKWELTLVDAVTGDTLIDWIPNGNTGSGTQEGLTVSAEGCNLARNASATFDQPSPPTQDCSGHFAATSNVVLLGGHRYTFTIDHHVTTQATEVTAVPEPGTLALLSVGLTGFGWASRKRHNG
jgi:hypothetical protein